MAPPRIVPSAIIHRFDPIPHDAADQPGHRIGNDGAAQQQIQVGFGELCDALVEENPMTNAHEQYAGQAHGLDDRRYGPFLDWSSQQLSPLGTEEPDIPNDSVAVQSLMDELAQLIGVDDAIVNAPAEGTAAHHANILRIGSDRLSEQGPGTILQPVHSIIENTHRSGSKRKRPEHCGNAPAKTKIQFPVKTNHSDPINSKTRAETQAALLELGFPMQQVNTSIIRWPCLCLVARLSARLFT
ncbi:MAG: hypothetical protein ACK5NY_02105 [Burkholderiaceae bacterium]